MLCFNETIFSKIKILLVLLAMPNMLAASDDIEKYHQQAKSLHQQVEISREQFEILSSQEISVLGLLEQIDMKLDRLKNQMAGYRSEISALDKQLQITRNRSIVLQKKIDTLRDYAKKRLVAIYKANQQGMLSVMMSADSMSEFLFRKKALETVLAHDKKVLGSLIQDQEELDRILSEISRQKQKKVNLEKKLNHEIASVALERKRRDRILHEIRNKKSMEHALMDAYRQAAISLDDTISALNDEKENPKTEGLISGKSFDTFKGLLNMPVNGTISARFGSYKDKNLNIERLCNGIFLRTDRGEPVHAVREGRILFAGWFKGYGKMIIIDHGHHYHTVYAHAEEIFKDKGDPVEAGEVIATVGDSGSVSGPELYFEVRHHGKPVDPLEWIKEG